MFYVIGEMYFKCLVFFDSIAKRHISTTNQKSMVEHFARIVINF